MKIKVIASKPIDDQDEINKYVGKVFETLELKNYYDTDVVKDMKKLGEVAVLIENGDKSPSILNKNEYEVVPD